MRRTVKTVLLAAAAVLLLLAAGYFIGTGFQKQGNAYLADVTVSDDGAEMTLHMGVATSVGYIRKLSVQQHGGRCYVTPYAAFGGINGRLGAKSEFSIPLAADTEIIALYRAKNAYQPVLSRHADGTWQYIPQEQE